MTYVTPEEIAKWMVDALERDDCLYQDTAVYDIAGRFGDEFTYINQNGNLAIDRRVLAAFRHLTEKTVVWERGERVWRKRHEADESGRRQH
jgi:uncharacterized protein DUF6953